MCDKSENVSISPNSIMLGSFKSLLKGTGTGERRTALARCPLTMPTCVGQPKVLPDFTSLSNEWQVVLSQSLDESDDGF